MARVERTLKDPGTRTLAIGGAPNARTIVPASVAAALASGAAPATIRELVEAVTAGNDAAVDPETLCELGEALGFRVELGWGRCDPSGRFDVLFQRAPDSAIAWPIDPGLPVLPWQRYANQPQLKTAAEPLVPAVRAHLRERLPDFMIPTAFVVVDALPLSPNGKLDVRSLPSPAEHAWLQEASAPPRTPVEQALAGIWQRLLGVEAVGLDDNFFEVGGHSLLAVKLFGEIEQTFGRKLPLSTLFRAPTLGRLAEAIGAAAAAPSASALAVLHPHGSRPPLILIHGVQGDVMEYRELVKGLGPDQPVYGIEALDAGQSGTVLRTIEQLAKGYVEALRQHQPTGPYFLCGYCWAGALTFEIAQQLRRKGDEVALLAMIDAGCPGHRRRRRPRHGGNGRPKRSTRILRNLKRLPEMDWTTVPRFLWDRTLRLATELAGVTAFRLSARLGRALFPAFQARRQTYLYAARAYRPREYPGRLTLFRGSSDGTVSGREALLGWERVVSGGVELHWVPGAHVGMLREPNVTVLARELQAALERARTGGEPISRDEPCEPHP
jgi:thioesterase domain-containing protein/acyl carrier protein